MWDTPGEMGTLTDPLDLLESESIYILREIYGRVAPPSYVLAHIEQTSALPDNIRRGAA